MEIAKCFCNISGQTEARFVVEIIKTLSTDFFLSFPSLFFHFLSFLLLILIASFLHIDNVKRCKHLSIPFLTTVFLPLPKKFLFVLHNISLSLDKPFRWIQSFISVKRPLTFHYVYWVLVYVWNPLNRLIAAAFKLWCFQFILLKILLWN